MANKGYISNRKRWSVIERDRFTCQHCGKIGEFIYRYDKPTVIENPRGIEFERYYYNGLDVISFEIDHIKPLSLGGDSNIDNLQLLCKHCNRSKGCKYGE